MTSNNHVEYPVEMRESCNTHRRDKLLLLPLPPLRPSFFLPCGCMLAGSSEGQVNDQGWWRADNYMSKLSSRLSGSTGVYINFSYVLTRVTPVRLHHGLEGEVQARRGSPVS